MDKSGALYGAINYAINQETYLRTFLDNPIIPLDNNDAERSIKKFVWANIAGILSLPSVVPEPVPSYTASLRLPKLMG